jgi:hypothetical protein
MDWIDKIKDTLGAWKLSHQVKVEKGIVNIPNFKDIQDIGLIYNATQAKEEEQITRIAHYLRDQGKKVWTMGFVESKTLPYNRKFHISSEYFWKEQLNFFNTPQKEKVGQFMSHKFDLLLNIYFEPLFPLQAMSSLCEAKYKMGAQLPNGLNYNHSVIDTGSDHSIQCLSPQMVHDLKVINQHD